MTADISSRSNPSSSYVRHSPGSVCLMEPCSCFQPLCAPSGGRNNQLGKSRVNAVQDLGNHLEEPVNGTWSPIIITADPSTALCIQQCLPRCGGGSAQSAQPCAPEPGVRAAGQGSGTTHSPRKNPARNNVGAVEGVKHPSGASPARAGPAWPRLGALPVSRAALP